MSSCLAISVAARTRIYFSISDPAAWPCSSVPDGSGNVATIKQHTNWDRDWEVIVPGNFGGGPHSDLFLYKRSSGVALFLSTDGSGNVATIKEHADWDRDWDVIVPGNFGGGPHSDLFLYKRSSGVALFGSTDGSGNVATIKEHADWDRDWDVIVPGKFGGGPHSDLFLYKRSSGVALFGRYRRQRQRSNDQRTCRLGSGLGCHRARQFR